MATWDQSQVAFPISGVARISHTCESEHLEPTGMINKKSSLYVDSRQRMTDRGWPARFALYSLAAYFLTHSIQLKIDR